MSNCDKNDFRELEILGIFPLLERKKKKKGKANVDRYRNRIETIWCGRYTDTMTSQMLPRSRVLLKSRLESTPSLAEGSSGRDQQKLHRDWL